MSSRMLSNFPSLNENEKLISVCANITWKKSGKRFEYLIDSRAEDILLTLIYFFFSCNSLGRIAQWVKALH